MRHRAAPGSPEGEFRPQWAAAHPTAAHPTTGRTVIVGGGLVGAALARRLGHDGRECLVARRRPRSAGEYALDVTTTAGQAALRRLTPGAVVVLVHGPSEVTWCDSHEREAVDAHLGAARAVAAQTAQDAQAARVVLVSTDNVFDGEAPRPTVTDPASPRNAYGRAKLAAEQVVLASGGMVARVSLVYGRRGDASLRPNFAETCLAAAATHRRLAAPIDQSFTPVHVDDVAGALAALVDGAALVNGAALIDGAGPDAGLVHLAGPALLSRFDFARIAYQVVGADPDLVTGVPRAATRWACRPRYSSLEPAVAHLPALAGFRPRGVLAGLADTAGALGLTAGSPNHLGDPSASDPVSSTCPGGPR